MKKCLLSILSLACCCVFAQAQPAPKREVRGAWIATFANIDWPKNRTLPVVLKRAELRAILDHHQATGINTIYFQIRSQCDAMYASSIEPWSADLTGTQGTPPLETSLVDPTSTTIWDPLQFMIDECHRRGMELHAWMNPYRAINNFNVIGTFSPNHVARQHPEWLLSQGLLRILDPGIPAAQAYVKRVVADVVSHYDIDGIHFDDYFYPYPPAAGVPVYNDDVTFNADPRGFTDRGEWRRDNINRFIAAVSDTIETLKPWVKFGVSPSGIYRNSTNPALGSATSGLQHYVTLFADSRKWLQQGWIDYLTPQVYWYIGQPGANYAVVVPWWNNNAYGRHIYIGMAGYKVNDPAQGGPNWAVPTVIPNEVRINRANANIYGQAIYNTSSLLSTTKLGFRDSLRLNFYKYPALIPRMPWRDDVAPEPATALTGIRHGADSVELTWIAPADVSNEFDKVKRFVIYRSENPVIDLTNPANIIAMPPAAVTYYKDKQLPKDTTYYYTVTSLDRFSNESLPSNVTDYLAPVIACVPNQQLDMDMSCELILPDYTVLASVSDDVSTSAAIGVSQSPEAGTVIHSPAITVVTLTATDASGKSSSCSFTVIGTDRLAPVVTATPENILVSTGDDAADCSAIVSWTEPIATDNCSTPLSYFSRTHAPGAAFAVGTTKVTYVFKDEAGNEDSTGFTIVVADDTKPVVITRNITRQLIGGAAIITAEDVNNASWDNCGISALTVSPATFTCANIGENIVTLTAVDIHGNENTAIAIVTITGSIPQPFINISRTNHVFTGLPDNTIALGYGAQALTLSVIDPATSSETYYSWSPATGLSNTNGSSTVFTPSEEGTYTFAVEVTNEYGCSSITEVTVHVIDVRCGRKDNKVQVCLTLGHHRVELCVAPQAVFALLKVRGKLGSCDANEFAREEEGASTDEVIQTSVLAAYPNPFQQHINLQFELPVADRHVILDIYDVYGEKVMRVFEGATESGQTQNFSVNTNALRGGVFLARLITSSGKSYHVKVIRQE
jgi:uncharacterized lipoprotein YddW (UPF0748 family)